MADKFSQNPIKDQSFAFTWSDIKALINHAKTNQNLRDYTLFVTLALSGRRVSEVVGRTNKNNVEIEPLKPENIDFDSKTIKWTIAKKFVDPKTRFIRVKKIKEAHPFMLKELKDFIEIRKIEPWQPIFKIGERRVNQIVHKYCKELGITNKARLVHAFRHGFAIESLKQCNTAEEMINVQKILDHTTFAMTENYLAFLDNKQREVLEKIKL